MYPDVITSPPQMYPTRPVNWSQSFLSSLCIPNPMINAVKHIQWWWNIHYEIMRFPMWRCLIILPISTPVPSEQESWTSENHCGESKSQYEKHLLIWKTSTWKTSTKVLCLWWGWNMKSSRFKMLDPTLVQILDRCYCAHFPAKRFKSEMSKSIHLNSTVFKSRQIFSFISPRFLGGDNPDTFFSRPQRSRCSISMLVVKKDPKLEMSIEKNIFSVRMVWEILCTTIFGNEKKGEVFI